MVEPAADTDDAAALPPPEALSVDPLHAQAATGALAQLSRLSGLYALVDAARDERVLALLQAHDARHDSLFEGEQGASLARWAPYLVALAPGSPLLHSLITAGWSRSWGLFVRSARPFKAVRRHFRRLLVVEVDGSPCYFRFYDPRVLRSFLPTCSGRQLSEMFADVDGYYAESKDGLSLLSYAHHGGQLQRLDTPLVAAG